MGLSQLVLVWFWNLGFSSGRHVLFLQGPLRFVSHALDANPVSLSVWDSLDDRAATRVWGDGGRVSGG